MLSVVKLIFIQKKSNNLKFNNHRYNKQALPLSRTLVPSRNSSNFYQSLQPQLRSQELNNSPRLLKLWSRYLEKWRLLSENLRIIRELHRDLRSRSYRSGSPSFLIPSSPLRRTSTSRILPWHSLKEPMLLSGFLCPEIQKKLSRVP